MLFRSGHIVLGVEQLQRDLGAVLVDGVGQRRVEYFNNSPDFGGSVGFAVTGATNTPNINAALFKP